MLRSLALAVALAAVVLAPLLSAHGWLLAYLSQTAAMIVFALSYNLLLGSTGLLSFGHAACSGLGALIAAQLFNRFGMPLPLLPLAGGLGGMLAGALLGIIATRRAGTAFAMITLGLGELVAAAAWTLPNWFGGEAGVPIDRAHGAWGGWSFGPANEAYAVIAGWCLLAGMAMFALSRTPLVRQAYAVRDNPVRVAALGGSPRQIRFRMMLLASFFAGIAGTLSLINVELVSAESVSMLRSGSVLMAVVIGGTASFFGPVLGAIVLNIFSVALAGVTRAWPLYLGLLFLVVVMVSPDGLMGLARRQAARLARYGWRPCALPALLSVLAVLAWSSAVVLVVQWAYGVAFSVDAPLNRSPGYWAQARMAWLGALMALLLAGAGALAYRGALRRWAQLAGMEAKASVGANAPVIETRGAS
ncbi:branched-chain amino acid ABC transporter permease [Paraburkholderia bonniea]|nr:branched-chain amino acid ABC transporter permease [Paraburkholderia bonniea]WJF91067.1 branched-chain amino acid ABC transporter permease [Paraburkholderia bonniea]WJF94381.1 branched-chain amino acid ABC transporter permease [Paraburkholderia bonniea]